MEPDVLTYFLQLHGVTFKKRAPRAIKEIKAFATKSMVRYTVARALDHWWKGSPYSAIDS